MEMSRAQEKRSLDEEEEEDDEEDAEKAKTGTASGKRPSSSGSSNTKAPYCQAVHCTADMAGAKKYHKRHKVCEFHAKEPVVLVAGIPQRFCQQCSRFHELLEFDDNKRSCRQRLAGHNLRRRKTSSEHHGEGSN